ncbi:hypothetical protein BDD12DRAFT_462081 [Trichophaea hybrida]|nr:hypothetical protein BDD12DRAFT_462081 [Trichophaea hybrida]
MESRPNPENGVPTGLNNGVPTDPNNGVPTGPECEVPTGSGNEMPTGPKNGVPTGPRKMHGRPIAKDCFWGSRCNYRRRNPRQDGSDLAEHTFSCHIGELRGSFPAGCRWGECEYLSQSQGELVNHLLHRHIGYTGKRNFLDVVQKKVRW